MIYVTAQRANNETWQQQIRHTKKNWTQIRSIQNDDQDMQSKELTKKTKIKIYETMIQPNFLCWTIRKQDEKRILPAEMSWLRRIAGVTRLHKIRTDDIRQAL